MPRLGASLRLTLRGHFHWLGAPLDDHAIECDLTLDFQGIRGTLLGRTGRVVGRICAEGVATSRVLEGTLGFRAAGDGQVLLTFGFEADDGGRRTLRGFVEVLPAAPLATATEVPFSLYSSSPDDADAEETARGVLRFDARGELRDVLRSLRLRVGAA